MLRRYERQWLADVVLKCLLDSCSEEAFCWGQVANLAQEFLQAIPDNFQDGLSIIASRDDVAQLAALRLPKLNIVSASARRLPTSTKYVLLLGLSRPQVLP